MAEILNDFMAKKDGDRITAEAWNRMVELLLNMEMRLSLLERRFEHEAEG